MKELRLLKANEIDARVGTISEKGASLLLYKDARVDMNILDETYPGAWKRSHELIDGNLFCTISIWNDDLKEWITRQDVGVESNTEKTKGQASDAFKRASFSFGIGRELYTAPFIWVNASDMNLVSAGKDNYGKEKFKTYDKFEVVTIGYDENKEINALTIKNSKTRRIVYTMGQQPKTPQATPGPKADDELTRAKKAINEELERQGITAPAAKRAKLVSIISKSTIDTIEDCEAVADGLGM